jgi:glycosyltransferase involved in cell wall biosynthesis
MTPYLSLVTPVYNGAAYIEDSLRAIVAALETLERAFEVIVVCDGSADLTAERARPWPPHRVAR